MSFLNPINEPVKRFKSTDAGAPQINYNARTAGDVKAVLKACLVTGYGAKSSAGWSIVNEVGHVCEFVSPSAAMSDYRLGIDDTSASSTTWYYQYQDARVNPQGNALSKSGAFMDKTSAANQWELLVTERGFYFIERVLFEKFGLLGDSLTYFGQTKSATTDLDKNIAWWCLGFSGNVSQDARPTSFFSASPNSVSQHVMLPVAVNTHINTNLALISAYENSSAKSYVDVTTPWFFGSNKEIVAQQVGCLLTPKKDTNIAQKTIINTIDGRAVLTVQPARGNDTTVDYWTQANRVYVSIYLDYWEY